MTEISLHVRSSKAVHRTVLFGTYAAAAGIVWAWGINTPIGLLIFAMVAMLALVSWLYRREVERLLLLAERAEADFLQQKTALRQKVKKRTAQLRQVQLKEMQQMYRFAELGQLGVMLLHDLANHLTALTLEMEGLQSRSNSQEIRRAQEILGYLEETVNNTRRRLYGHTQKQTFDIVRSTNEVIDFLSYKAAKAQVTIDWKPPAYSWNYVGDCTSFCQVIAIIISNAIDAYRVTAQDAREPMRAKPLEISMQRNAKHYIIIISDWGKGISKSQRKQLFQPFNTTKKAGLGIGLFIARQTVAINFGGTITLNPKSDHTQFVIKFPIQNKR